MKNIIHNIRKQPEEIRRHILHLITVVFAIILVFLWVYSLGANLSSSETQAGISQDLKPFSTLKDNMVSGYSDISQPSTSTDNTDQNSDAYLRAQENSL
ncbi:MAG: hypothetical protein P4L63_01620 [Candidatus Pacebacteria bacterium]|nr:hypothetical protein [Candidatus Paceibacterota bacterium]